MKISSMSNRNNVPEWAIRNTKLASLEQNETLLDTAVDRINATEADCVSEFDIVQECEYIEKCASTNQPYFYNTTWNNDHVSHIREYASVCGLNGDKVIGVDPSSLVEAQTQQRQASSEQMVRTASTNDTTLSDALQVALGDPFHIEKHTDMSHMEKADWQEIGKQATLPEFSTTSAMKGAILPLRGGEDYTISNQQPMASNQNSIVDAGALDRLWASEEEDTGQRLKREREEREATRTHNHQAWEQEYIDQMKYDDKIEFDITASSGVVFPTEVMNAQPGLNRPSSNMGVYGDFDPNSIPEKTAGENLKSQNEERKASIQRDGEEDRSWDELQAAPTRMISDTFTDELKKFMK